MKTKRLKYAAVITAFAGCLATGPALALDIKPGPGEAGSCMNRKAETITVVDGQYTQYQWCAADSATSPGYAQRDRYTRTLNGMPWKYQDPNYLFGCQSEQIFIMSSVGPNGYAIVCP